MNIHDRRPGGFARLLGALARRTTLRRVVGGENPLDTLNDHYLRDIGIWRERSAGPRRYDPWM